MLRRPGVGRLVRTWESEPAGARRLATGPLLVTDRDLVHEVMTHAELYHEQSAFLRTRSHSPLPSLQRYEVIGGLMTAISTFQGSPAEIPPHVFPGRRGVVTQAWGIWWMRHLFRQAFAHRRPEVFDPLIDHYVSRKIIGEDVNGRLLRMPVRERDKLLLALGTQIIARCPRDQASTGDLVDAVGTAQLDLPAVEIGELYARLVHSVVTFTGTALEWAVLLAAQNDRFRAALRAHEDVRPYLLEALRLYPITWRLGRMVRQVHTIGGEEVREGDDVMVVISAMHHSHAYWHRPAEFLPERWADPECRRNRAFMPFGRGRGMCPGREVALRVVSESLSWIFQRYDVLFSGRVGAPHVRSIYAPPRLRLHFRPRRQPA